MANLAASAVSINRSYVTVAGTDGIRSVVDATLTLTGQGGTTNLIPVSLLGLSSAESVLSARGDDSLIYRADVSYDGKSIVLANAASGAPSDITDTIRVVVSGVRL